MDNSTSDRFLVTCTLSLTSNETFAYLSQRPVASGLISTTISETCILAIIVRNLFLKFVNPKLFPKYFFV